MIQPGWITMSGLPPVANVSEDIAARQPWANSGLAVDISIIGMELHP